MQTLYIFILVVTALIYTKKNNFLNREYQQDLTLGCTYDLKGPLKNCCSPAASLKFDYISYIVIYSKNFALDERYHHLFQVDSAFLPSPYGDCVDDDSPLQEEDVYAEQIDKLKYSAKVFNLRNSLTSVQSYCFTISVDYSDRILILGTSIWQRDFIIFFELRERDIETILTFV